MRLSFIIPSRPGTDLSRIKAEVAGLDLDGHAAEFFFVEGTLPPVQRNVAIRKTTGDYIFLLDDDVLVPPDLVRKTLARFTDERIAAVGGPNLTPASDPLFAQLSGELLASPIATGQTSYRWRLGPDEVDANESHLHACFVCFRGDLLRRYLFCEDLFPSEETELYLRLRRDGYRLCYAPECAVQHKRRATLAAHLRQTYLSGRGRGEFIRRDGVRGHLHYLAPTALLVYIATAGFLTPFGPVVALPALAYAIMAASLSIKTSLRRRRLLFLWIGPLMFASHLAYGAALLQGLLAPRRLDGRTLGVEVVERDETRGAAVGTHDPVFGVSETQPDGGRP